MTTRRAGLTLWRLLRQSVEDAAQHSHPAHWHYTSPMDFLQQHGRWYDNAPRPSHLPLGAPGMCYGNALLFADIYGLQYVKGVALVPDQDVYFLHAWCTDATGAAIEVTTPTPWRAYFGMPFSQERADSATWRGDACVLNDFRRSHPLLWRRWDGERPIKNYRMSPPRKTLRKRLAQGWRPGNGQILYGQGHR